ncbi:MAG: translation initiation factor IF-2 [Bacteriovoracaceae bacterium]|nr:translation initiation factor IF-2 [Bacteriovoracaceae bacterium]
MPKKVFELANEIGVSSIDMVEKLKSAGFNVRNHMVTLSDDEVKKALEVYEPNKEAKTAKKKTTKKKTTKKVTKKTVVKKVVKKAAAAPVEKEPAPAPIEEVKPKEKPVEEEKVEAVEAVEAKPAPKKTTVVRKKKPTSKTAAKSETGATPAQESGRMPDKMDEIDKKEVFKEKMHTFTPVYVPDEKEKEEARAKAQKAAQPRQAPGSEADALQDDKNKKDSKKRMGDLAAMVSKKGAVGKTKDITNIRAEEEMKLAGNIIGRQVYTPVRRKKVFSGNTKQTEITEVKQSKRVVNIHRSVTALDLSNKLAVKFEKLRNDALEMNLLIKEDDYLGVALASEIASMYDYRVEDKAFDEQEVLKSTVKAPKSDLPLRNPIITVMGHVDHGKTTLLDYIRDAKVTAGEAGGITQHIGAYSVPVGQTTLTFLDTPGHAAFANMRQRGANVTDIVILVVAADDGVMPQTKESIKFAKNANCPIIVAVNKMDKEGANPERIKQELTEFELVSEDWGGDTMFVPISALKGEGVDELLESVKLQAEMLELRESPKGNAEGVIIESKVEAGRGPVATVLVQKGTLKKGDAIVCDEFYGRARSLTDHSGKDVKSAGPSIPVQILGLNGVPGPGATLNVAKNEREAKKVAENRANERKKLESVEAPKVNSLEDFFSSAPTDVGEKKILNLVVRADVQGSYEAIKDALVGLGNDEVGVSIVTGGVGAITDNDVVMATSSSGIIIGFNMRPMTSARRLAEQNGVEVRTYSIIYELINDVTLALEGMLEPESIEKYIGRAEVRDTFNIPKIGTIAGTAVIDGKIERGCNIRLLRDGKIIYDGKLSTLKRFKDEVKEVSNGYECGMALEGFNDIKNNDLIEAYILEQKQRKLEASERTL